MTTVALQVPLIRRLLNDDPIEAHLNGAIANGTEETVVVDSTDIAKVKVGQTWEHSVGGELRRVISVDVDNNQFEAYRAWKDTTAASSHADNSFIYLDPRFSYAAIEQAINTCLDSDLFPDIYQIVEHQVTSNTPANGTTYNAPSTACEQFLDVYQRTVSTDPPQRAGIRYTVFPQNVDTAHWSNGKMFEIQGGKQDGSEKFYVNCAHRLDISTVTTREERILQFCAVKYLLEWTTPRRLQGPTNQGDRSVRPLDPTQTAAYWEQKFLKAKRDDEEWLRKQVPPRSLFIRSGGPVFYQAG